MIKIERTLIARYGRADHLTIKVVAILLLFAVTPLGSLDLAAQSESSIRNEFKNPAKKYRPMVRWWWPGDAVTDTEIQREIGLLDDAWIGGAEIQPFTLYFQSGLSKDDQTKVSSGYGTPSFFNHVRDAVEAARNHVSRAK